MPAHMLGDLIASRVRIALQQIGYPRIRLSAEVAELGLVGGPSGVAWSLIGGLTAPVFHGGALPANRRAAQEAYKATFAQY